MALAGFTFDDAGARTRLAVLREVRRKTRAKRARGVAEAGSETRTIA
jgi:hypothetical protein